VPPLVEGQGPRGASSHPTGELLVRAVMEPNADGDGFGDETQDSCPTERTNQGACDTTGPRVRRIAVRRAGCSTGSQRTRPSPSASSERAAPATSPCAGVHRRGAAGANVRSLPRRFRSRNLPAGTYRLIVRAVDAAGSATRKTKRFTVE
jgi:hypothetical protein